MPGRCAVEDAARSSVVRSLEGREPEACAKGVLHDVGPVVRADRAGDETVRVTTRPAGPPEAAAGSTHAEPVCIDRDTEPPGRIPTHDRVHAGAVRGCHLVP